ncbi:hypothetical protein R80B4_01550 [Fibrobacteres bacterium R8-0-B4]
MELYHASNMEVNRPRIMNLKANLDFGAGFYTTANKGQAEDFAAKVYLRQGKKGAPTVSVYEFDDSAIKLKTLKFKSPSYKWFDFVVHNRKYGRSEDGYDLIVGPIANDNVFFVIALYERGQETRAGAIRRFKVRKLFNQYLFCNERALSALTFIKSYTLRVK